MKKNYIDIPEDQKHDIQPEVLNGRNVADFIDPDIAKKLMELEAEEERLEASGFYDDQEDDEGSDEDEIHRKAELIREKRQLIRNDAKMKKSLKNRAIIPRGARPTNLNTMADALTGAGYDPSSIVNRARSQSRGRSIVSRGRSAGGDNDAEMMDVDGAGKVPPRDASAARKALLERSMSRARSQSTNRRMDGVKNETAATKAEKLQKLSTRHRNRMARAGEGDVSDLLDFLFSPTCFLALWR